MNEPIHAVNVEPLSSLGKRLSMIPHYPPKDLSNMKGLVQTKMFGQTKSKTAIANGVQTKKRGTRRRRTIRKGVRRGGTKRVRR